MPISFVGAVAEAEVWRDVSRVVEDWLDTCATPAAQWTLTVWRKTP